MTKSDATPEEDQPATTGGVPSVEEPWWRQWLGPGVAATIISALIIALVTVGVAGFNSLKGDMRDLKSDMRDLKSDMRDMGAMLGQQIEMLKLDTMASETRLRQDIKELRADNRALNDKLDRLLESFLAART
ncbi:MAG: hypothetical protein F4162_06260 [Synechococcus sp. SB0676_bin_10]|uniref:Uncharacterized protein n=1 Tax=Synechococcus sp. SB0676_bin_10 TaxID=2604869 RepID=A0A6B1F5F5_9SYNE|nr:hypothetical protein [Cyanobacteria bacterium MAG IRC3_bin_20]MXY18560.1 hypothetical protein [Synechococcus sp. SB0664_bin_36]MYG38570.1 hypothetical protein [Synechococcus sp. SB0676_bin_10]MYK06644.1 hypothetical protein [Synechococcus sp. SB0670_bin_20]